MTDFVLSCGSTADVTAEQIRERNIDCISFYYTVNGTEYADDLGQSLGYEEFYDMLKVGADTKTVQLNVYQYCEHFRPILASGKDILHISMSSGITGTNNPLRIAMSMLKEEFPERKLYIVDSLGASGGYALIMETLADLRDQGMSMDELYEWIENNKLRMHHWFFSTDLSYYVKGGRITKTEGFIGSMLNICPLCNMDREGHLVPREKIRTKKRVIREIEQRMEQFAEDGLNYSGKCFLSHAGCYEDARAVADIIEERFPHLNGKVTIHSIGPTVGSHTGPYTVALFFWGSERVD